jgi:RNA polymerase sigma-70 factor (ECF subfamily)
MDIANSQALLKRLRANDEDALQSIFHTFYPLVYKSILKLVADIQIAEDLSQNVFLKFWEKRSQLQIEGPLLPYIKRMAINEALSQLRKQAKFNTEEVDEEMTAFVRAPSDQEFLDNELRKAVNQAIEQLPPRCQAIYKLSRFEELSYKEIAQN